MTTSSRGLIVLWVSLLLLGPGGARPALSESQEKDSVPEKPAPRPQQPPTASDNQSAPQKPSTESKPSAPPPKADTSTDHKENAPEKPASRPNQSSTTADSPPPPSKPATEPKAQEKDNGSEKPAPRPQPHPVPPKSPESKTPPQAAPPTKPEAPPPQADHDAKEKEPAVKKPLGSLILSVKLALLGDARFFHYEIEAEDDQQTITLTGRVVSDEHKAAVIELAQTVPGVKAVVNKLTVEKDLAKTLSRKQDDILTGLIKERFAKSATVKAANFEVKTEDGIVQLTGAVRFQVIAFEAAEMARQVPGVRAVNTEKIRLEGES